jgi:hypothetical protein
MHWQGEINSLGHFAQVDAQARAVSAGKGRLEVRKHYETGMRPNLLRTARVRTYECPADHDLMQAAFNGSSG